MAQFLKHYMQDLTQNLVIRREGTIVFCSDEDSVVITVDLFNGTEPASLAGTATGSVIRADGTTVLIRDAYVSGNTATMTLKAGAFHIPGDIGVGLQISSGGAKTTVLKAVYNVELLSTDLFIDPDEEIVQDATSLINMIEDAVATIPADYSDLLAAIAPAFSNNTAYSKGEYVWYEGELWRFDEDHAAGAWTGTDATVTTMAGDLSDAVNNIILVQTTQPTAAGNKLWIPPVSEEVQVLCGDDIATVAETRQYLG